VDFIGFLSIACVILFGMLGFFLIMGIRRKSTSNMLLGIFFLLWALNFLDGWLLISGFYLHYPSLAMWEEPFAFLYGPLIYFYAKTLISGLDIRVSLVKILPHLIPFFFLTIILVISYHIRSDEFKLNILNTLYEYQPSPRSFIPILLVFIHIFIYIYFAYKVIAKFDLLYKQNYSNQTKWFDDNLKYIVMILVLSLIVSIVQNLGSPWISKLALVILILSVLLFIGQIYFQAFKDPKVFVNGAENKYRGNQLMDEEQNKIKEKVERAFEMDKIHLNPDLTINDLSESIGEFPRDVSQVINELFGLSFFDLVNSFRIRESKKIISENVDPRKTVLEIMYESGFNSKSSFNTQFKKLTGLTPSEFKKLHS